MNYDKRKKKHRPIVVISDVGVKVKKRLAAEKRAKTRKRLPRFVVSDADIVRSIAEILIAM